MRKKTYLEQLQDRVNGNSDTSVYTDKEKTKVSNSSVRDQVDNLYNRNKTNIQQDDIWERVKSRAKDILNDNKNIIKNLGIGISSSAKNGLYYIENSSENIFSNYKKQNQLNARLKKDKEEKEKIINGNYNNINKTLSTIENLHKENKMAKFQNPILQKAKENLDLKSPILEGFENSILKDEEKIQKNIENSKTKVGKKVAELMPSIGQSVSGMVAGMVNPALGLAYFQTSAGGNYTREAKAKGLNEKQAMTYGTIMGAMESITESIGAKLTTGVGKSVFKDGAKEGLKAFGLDVAENFFEEAIMEPIQETVMKATGGQADWSNMAQRMWNSGIDGALTSVIMGGASAGIGKATKLITKIENGQQIKQEDIVETLKEINDSEEVDIEKLLVNSFQFTAEDLIRNTDVQKSTNKKLEKIASEMSQAEKEFLIRKNQQPIIKNEQILNNNQQVNHKQDKNSQNQFSNEIEENKQNQVNIVDENQRKLEKVLQKDKYKENQNASNFFKSANENNLDISNEKIESLFDLPNARGIKTEFNQEMFKNQNGNIKENINAIYVTDSEGNRNIIYNPKANQENIVEKNVIHETFHDMAGTKEAQEITDFVYNKIKDTADFQDAFNNLKEVYSQVTDNEGRILYNSESVEFENMIKEEAVADYLGRNLGTQEYINELVNGKESRNVAQKIYDAIVKFLDKVTGYKSEEAYLRGLKDKFEKAFNSEYANSNEQTKYSIAGKKAMENAINKDSQYKIIEESYNKALKMAKENVDNEQIRQKTNWFQDKNGDWKFEFSDKDMKLKKFLKENSNYKLGDILNHDILFDLYPELKQYNVETVNLRNNAKGSHVSSKKTIYISNKLLTSNQNIEATLIHEIQHAIQKSENFEGGKSTNKSKLAYYNSLGEIEASDVSKRFIEEKYNKKDLSNILPESSKKNPKHSNLDNYLENRGIVDKIRDKVYSGLKDYLNQKSEDYNESFEENNSKNNNQNSNMVVERRRYLKDNTSNKELENNSSSFSLQENRGKWQEFLDKNTINKEGTRTTLKEIKLPKKQNKSIVSNINDNKPTRHDVIQENRKIAKENIKNIATWKDKKSGLKYQLETMERNIYDIIPDKQEAKKVIETYFEPVHVKEAEKQKFINKYNNRIQELKLNKYESEATQFLGELKYNPNFKMTPELKRILDKINNNIQNGKINKEKIDNAIETFRNIYDELFDIENNELRRNGYQEKTYRRGYFPHFIDYVPETRTEKVLNKLGFKIDKRALPTDISGITEQFVPGKTWNQSSLERKTNKTDFNALKGFDTYIAQASDNIFHTENIQKLRALENEIRYQYSEKGIQAEIDSILNNETLNQEEKQALIDQKFEQIANPMPNLVVELRRYTNALANKKSEADRSTEQTAGRQFYSIVNAIENRFAGNAVGLNMGSALTNFIPITQAYSQVSSINMGRAMLDTMKSYMKDDGFIDKSTFLTNRLNKSEKLYKTALEKISEKANIPFDAVDSITSNIVVRGKYLENIKNGMSETEAIKNADSFAASLMADRSKGSLPTKFEEKNPLTKAFTQFQLEVNNQYRYILKDIPRDLKDKGLGNLALAYFKMFITAWLYNKISKEMTGRDQAFSPIDLIKSSYDTIMNDDLNTYNKITNIATEFGEQAPFIGGLLGGGRIPVNGALPDIANITKAGVGLATGEMDTKKAFKSLGKEIAKPGYYLLPPFGGGQLKKTVEGIKTVKEGGSYGIDNKGQKTLQFPVENKSAGDYIKAGVFGKYSLPKAKSYVDNKFKSFNAKQTQLYDNSDIEYDTLKEYFDYSSQKGIKQKDKIEHINTMKISTDDKWNLYKYNILSSNKRKDGTSQVTDAEYAIKNKLATKSNYMKLYENAIKNNIDFPDTDSLKELKENGLSLNTYIDYNINYKNASEEKKNLYKNKLPVSKETMSLKLNEKVELMKNYTVEEKRIIYSNYINKEDEIYKTISKLEYGETNIDEYLDYKIQNFESDENTKSNIAGKKVSKGEGTSKNKTLNYINNSNMTDLEKAYIVETTYKGVLNSKTLEELTNIVKNKITDKKELEEVLDKFKDLEKHKDDGNYYKK